MKIIDLIEQSEKPVDHGHVVALALEIYGQPPSKLASYLGVKPQQISAILKTKKINDERMQEIAAFFKMTLGELLDIAECPLTTLLTVQLLEIENYLRGKDVKNGRYFAKLQKPIADIKNVIYMLETEG
jgi:transcriptional regulator with XRE-family HTH domain